MKVLALFFGLVVASAASAQVGLSASYMGHRASMRGGKLCYTPPKAKRVINITFPALVQGKVVALKMGPRKVVDDSGRVFIDGVVIYISLCQKGKLKTWYHTPSDGKTWDPVEIPIRRYGVRPAPAN